MRLFNFGAIGAITVAWVIRFYYFGNRERVVEVPVTRENSDGETETDTVLERRYTRDTFWMFVYTLFVIPIIIFIFVI